MARPHMTYFEGEDVLHVCLAEEPESSSVEVSPNITAELNERGELVGIEILEASRYIRDTILDSVQARLLQLNRSGPGAI